ncbi:MAG: hypothetical protein IPO35_16910 [Uliginosibacterium sp.]|nr:hypothetical protein [Uliginosibacterium sp.]
MKYYKLCGNSLDSIYALDRENNVCSVVEFWKNNGTVTTVNMALFSAALASYDVQAAGEIETYEKIYKSEWEFFKRTARDFLKIMGDVDAE